MLISKSKFAARIAVAAAVVSICQGVVAADAPLSKEMQNMMEFQCNAVKTLKQAEANYADLSRGYTDQHPVVACLKKKIEELKAAGK